MRQLSPVEQQLMTRMQKGQGNNLPNLIDPFLDKIRIRFNRQAKQVDILAETTQSIPEGGELAEVMERINMTSQIIVSAVNLINLLNREGYVILYTAANQIEDEITFGQGVSNAPFVAHKFPDTRITDLLIQYSTQEIVFTPEAEEYVVNNFTTRDELRHQNNITLAKRSIRIACGGVIVAIVTVLISLGLDIYDRNKTIDTTQQDKIENIDTDLDKTNDNLDKLIELQVQEVKLLQQLSLPPADTTPSDSKEK